MAPGQTAARRCLQILPGWIPTPLSRTVAQLAISDTPRAHEILAAFRKDAEFSILVTVTMAYGGPDAPEAAVVAASTHIRSRVRLERMIARAMRVDPHGGDHARYATLEQSGHMPI